MMEAVSWVLWFVVVVGVLVTVHEFGHFWVARRLGIRVLRFSVGFGKTLWMRKGKDGTEYVIAAVPLGGYVKMLDEREGPVEPAERDRAFNTQTVGKRIAVVIAGPIANFLFAIVAFAGMYMVGITDYRPVVGEVTGLAATAGFESGELIISIDGVPTPTWSEAGIELLNGVLDRRSLTIMVRDLEDAQHQRVLDLRELDEAVDENKLLQELGFSLWKPDLPPVISSVSGDSAAERAGFQAGDRVVSVDGESVSSWGQWQELIRSHPQEMLEVIVEREGVQLDLLVVPDLREMDDGPIGFLGVTREIPPDVIDRLYTTQRFGPIRAIGRGFGETWRVSTLTLGMVGRMVTGRASLKNLSGPISIARYANDTARGGVSTFLRFLAVLSVSLGILNILPIPVLDGGHLMYYLIEVVKGSPVSERAQFVGQRIGIGLLLGLMAVVFYNDILRLFPG